MANFEDVGNALQLMGEISGRAISPGAAAMMAQDLSGHPPDAVLSALQSCRQELNRFPTVHDIISRIESRDGRPGAEEAWSMIPKDETGSVVWSDEMSGAYAVAYPLLKSGDEVAARMAFKEKYAAMVKESRGLKQKPQWRMSPGTDKSGRNGAISEALRLGRIFESDPITKELLTAPENKKLSLPDFTESTPPEEAKLKIQEMLKNITKTIGEEK